MHTQICIHFSQSPVFICANHIPSSILHTRILLNSHPHTHLHNLCFIKHPKDNFRTSCFFTATTIHITSKHSSLSPQPSRQQPSRHCQTETSALHRAAATRQEATLITTNIKILIEPSLLITSKCFIIRLLVEEMVDNQLFRQ